MRVATRDAIVFIILPRAICHAAAMLMRLPPASEACCAASAPRKQHACFAPRASRARFMRAKYVASAEEAAFLPRQQACSIDAGGASAAVWREASSHGERRRVSDACAKSGVRERSCRGPRRSVPRRGSRAQITFI